ncbi:hypothetical protein H0H10_21460 [Streptomyces sp. TRM S81-3]|uniref:SAM-dependent methyltransferase n=1 Tax=Streptomyces griseicoloratus TaxID=2752516 RepID=A0A926QT57_9ACTN|nr:hypothetical protein [Streptomyces griseicoloratus]MBD0421687.1 hypothetical protein [Streptomyces griseicoloratus]
MPDYSSLLRHYQPVSVIERDGDFLIDQSSLDPMTGRSTVQRTIIKGGQTRRAHFFVRLFTYVELKEWLTAAGFREVRGVDESGGPLTDGSRRMVVLARKQERPVSIPSSSSGTPSASRQSPTGSRGSGHNVDGEPRPEPR